MEFEELLQILLLVAITIRILALYKHMKLYHQMNRHIRETEISLERLDKTMEVLNHHILNLLKYKSENHFYRLREDCEKRESSA